MAARKPVASAARVLVSPVVTSGDRRRSLEALRDRLAQCIDATRSARDTATLTRRLADVLAELDSISSRGTATDELKRRREKRRAAARRAAAGGGGV